MLTLFNQDSVEALRSLADGSVQLVVTSPPYDALRSYGGHSWDFEGTARELYRVLCDGGVLCWNVGDQVINGSESLTAFKQVIFFKETVGFLVHDTMIWEKTHVACPDSTRYHQMFEYVFVLSNGKPKTFNRIKDRRNKWAGASPFSYNSKRLVNGDIKRTREVEDRGQIAEFGSRSNVWKGNSRAQDEPCATLPHPAMMPKWLVRDLILSWSNPGDLVADPFAGSGTTGREAIANGRRAWLNEIEPSYIRLCEEACNTTLGLAISVA